MLYEVRQATDDQLYTRWSAGDEDAGQLLMQLRMPGVRRVVRSLLSDAEAQDAVQEVFERLARRARAGLPIKHLRSFVGGIARNVMHEQFRNRRRAPFNPYEHSLADIRPDQCEAIERHENNRLLLKALHRMPVDDQILLALRYWEMLRTRHLAEILELKHSTLRTRLARAEQRLRELVTQLAESPEALESTLGSFSDWAQENQRKLAAPGLEVLEG